MIMTWVFTILANLFILIGMIAIFFFVKEMITEESNKIEKVIRTASAMTGFLTYFGSKAIGLSIPDIMMKAIATTNPFSFGLFALLVPSATGYLVAWYTLRRIKQSDDIASRLVIMFMTFILVMFCDVYAATYQVQLPKSQTMKALVPNLTFTVAMSLYVILQYKHNNNKKLR